MFPGYDIRKTIALVFSLFISSSVVLGGIFFIGFNLHLNTGPALTGLEVRSECIPVLTLLAVPLGGIIITSGIIFRYLHSTLKRIYRITESLDEVAAGNFTNVIVDEGTDEIAHLTAAINDMVGKIREYHEDDKRMLANHFMYEKLTAIGETAAGTAHEIRNPLTSIKGFTYLLQDKFKHGEQGWEYAQIIKKEVQHIEGIINQFLMMAVPTFPVMKQSSIHELIDQLLPDTAMYAVDNGVLIETDFSGGLPEVYLDRPQITQLVSNLCINSIQAMPNGGTLKIQTKYSGENNMVTLIISDTGTGIPPDVLNRIADPFFTTREEAVGLGLTVCYRIVQNHDGIMQVNSIEGVGTTCIVKLPVR